MYRLSVQSVFSAAHAISIAGQAEAIHGHDWRVTAVISGAELDADGVLCDFHTVHHVLEEIVGPWRNRNLNDSPVFAGRNPSAEHVARQIAERMREALDDALAPHARVESVSVTESPGCEATYVVPVP